jgi:hypothetical protein
MKVPELILFYLAWIIYPSLDKSLMLEESNISIGWALNKRGRMNPTRNL